jgi:hypothetical protein
MFGMMNHPHFGRTRRAIMTLKDRLWLLSPTDRTNFLLLSHSDYWTILKFTSSLFQSRGSEFSMKSPTSTSTHLRASHRRIWSPLTNVDQLYNETTTSLSSTYRSIKTSTSLPSSDVLTNYENVNSLLGVDAYRSITIRKTFQGECLILFASLIYYKY